MKTLERVGLWLFAKNPPPKETRKEFKRVSFLVRNFQKCTDKKGNLEVIIFLISLN
jgi:hypothetical protein